MKKILTFMAAILIGGFLFSGIAGMNVRAAEKNDVDVSGLLGNVKEELSDALSKMDEETVKGILGFVKEKVADGSLKTDKGLSDAIAEGEKEFGVTIDKADAQKVVDTMEKLEEMGFSGEHIMEKTEELYDKYGADFVEHVDEVVAGAVQEAVADAADSFIKNIWISTKSFVKSLFVKG